MNCVDGLNRTGRAPRYAAGEQLRSHHCEKRIPTRVIEAHPNVLLVIQFHRYLVTKPGVFTENLELIFHRCFEEFLELDRRRFGTELQSTVTMREIHRESMVLADASEGQNCALHTGGHYEQQACQCVLGKEYFCFRLCQLLRHESRKCRTRLHTSCDRKNLPFPALHIDTLAMCKLRLPGDHKFKRHFHQTIFRLSAKDLQTITLQATIVHAETLRC
jgi:hypothetical protein